MKKRIFIICLLLAAAMIINAQDQREKASAAERLGKAIDELGLDTALNIFAKLRENPGSFNFSQQEFNESGVWSKPVNLCEHGLPAGSYSGTYSPDGKYFFFHNEGDIYWISSEFIESLRPDKKKWGNPK